MICFPNAKINIGLRILEKRPDGYHNLETVFYPIGLKDALEMSENPQDLDYSIQVTGINASEIDLDAESNIVTKAFRLLQKKYHLPPPSVLLHKGIPSGAGLGGGSSDAANTLKILNSMHNLGLSEEVLMHFSAQLGADCAFFIKNYPIFARGIGTEFETTALSLKGWFLILVKPDVHVSTAEAYSRVKPVLPERSLKTLIALPVEHWKDTVVNDFEASVFTQYPYLGELKRILYKKGAVYASMSGSGASVFGLFREPIDLKADFPGCFYWNEILSI